MRCDVHRQGKWGSVGAGGGIKLALRRTCAGFSIMASANVDAAKMWRDDIDKFAEVAQDHVRLSIEMPEKDYFPIPETT